jgi:hypothetical protein
MRRPVGAVVSQGCLACLVRLLMAVALGWLSFTTASCLLHWLLH